MSTVQEMGQIMSRAAKAMKDNGHICVLLDFIPVVERLPDKRVIVLTISIAGSLFKAFVNDGLEWEDASDGIVFNQGVITHWAEIPEVDNAS